jgi:glyoxylate reductase
LISTVENVIYEQEYRIERGGYIVGKPIVVVTNHFLGEVEARIEREYIARRNPNKTPFTLEELLSISEGADAMLVTSFDRLDSAFFGRVSSSVKIIATYSAGYEHIDLGAAYEEDSDCTYSGS